MALADALKKKLNSKGEKKLIDLLCKADEELRLSELLDLSSVAEARFLEGEFAKRTDIQAKLVRRAIASILLRRLGPGRFLDERRIREAVDRDGMLPRLKNLYRQMLGMNEEMLKFVRMKGRIPAAKRIVAFGLGGSAIGAYLAREIIQNQGYCVPLEIHTSYPENFHGICSETLVVICSFSGNTEETLYAFDYAQKRTKNILILSRGGELGRLRDEYAFIEIPKSDIQAPRESIGFWLSAFLFIVSSLGLAKNDDGTSYNFDISEVEAVRRQLDEIDGTCAPEVPFKDNPAKQYATYFLYGTHSGEPSARIDWGEPREPVVFLDGTDRAIGKRLASQFAECPEHPVALVVFCEDAHNEIESVATVMLEDELRGRGRRRSYVFISSGACEAEGLSHRESRAAQRIEATLTKLFDEHRVDFLRVETEGASLLGRKLSLLKLLDWTAVYASILLGTNPLPVRFMDMMKDETAKIVGAADREFLRLLVEGGRFPASEEEVLSDERVRRSFPALKRTILKRLIEQGYLKVESGMLDVTDKGKELIEPAR